MILVVQEIKTSWSKASRGGTAAIGRNAVPEIARLPRADKCKSARSALYHSLLYVESNGFVNPREKIVLDPSLPLQIGGVTLERNGDEARADFAWTRECGAPDRGWARKTMVIRPQEWGQIVYNGRLSLGWDSEWSYEKTVVNFGLFEVFRPYAFTAHPATDRFEAMAHLF